MDCNDTYDYDDDCCDRSVYALLHAADQARRHRNCEHAYAGLPALRERLSVLGLEVRHPQVTGDVPPDTYEIWRDEERLGYWWPSRGKTRRGNSAGKICKTWERFAAYVETWTHTPGAPRPKRAATYRELAQWLGDHLPGATNVWQPPSRAAMRRVYRRDGEYIEVQRRGTVRCSSPEIERDFAALCAEHGLERTDVGSWVLPSRRAA